MEDVLEVYALPDDPAVPVVCFDERPCQLLADTRPAQLPLPGQLAHIDYEYERHGTANLFMFFQPLGCWRFTKVTAQRTKTDFAECMRELVDVHFPEATTIRVILDNLNTHSPAALYSAFSPAEARRLLHKLEFHYTPKHASWLNMVEIELSVLSRQCLGQRLPDLATLSAHTTAWTLDRNLRQATVHWQFSLENARTKLARLYPKSNASEY
jgi:DDE superfamily endonuclease